MIWILFIAGGFALGSAVGRWWALMFPIALGFVIAIKTPVENNVLLGAGYAVITGAAVAAGVALRRRRRHAPRV